MKIIDLLNKIAKGEEVPKKIKYTWFYEWSYDNTRDEYCYMQKNGDRFDSDWLIESILTDEIEIIEEEKEIPIYNIDNMKIAGEKAWEVYRRLYEGFKKGWNAPIEKEKEIEKIIISMDDDSMPYVTNNKYQKLSYSEVDLLFASKINELIDLINDMRDKE